MECFFECCYVDDDIIRKKDAPKIKKIISILLLIAIAAFLVVIFVLNLQWFKRLLPYYWKAGGKSAMVCAFAIITAGVAALACLLFIFYFITGFCAKKCKCFWFSFSFFVWASIILQFISYGFGIASNVSGVKCSDALSECYDGMYNKTLGKLDYINHDEEYNLELYRQYYEFEKWYQDKFFNLNDICEKILSPALTIEILLFVCYVSLILIYGGWDYFQSHCCCCCCCCKCRIDCDKCWNCCSSGTQVSNYNENDKKKENSDNENSEQKASESSLSPNQNDQNTVSDANDQNINVAIPNGNF